MNKLRINVLIEGGVGDIMLATRFIAATRDKHPDSFITVFVNNENNKLFNSFLERHWSYLWDAFVPDVERKSKDFHIISQFGQETYNGAFENLTEEWQAKIKDCDQFYNFHLDALNFFDYDIPWVKYLRHVPTPRNVDKPTGVDNQTVIANLYARAGHFSGITQEQSDALLTSLRNTRNVIALAPSQEVKETFYKNHADIVRVTDLSESLSLISECGAGLSIDTGIRCMFYAFGKPCFTFCKLCQQAFTIPNSHAVRWYVIPEYMLPVDAKPLFVSSLVDGVISKPACALYPQCPADNIDNFLLRRRYA